MEKTVDISEMRQMPIEPGLACFGWPTSHNLRVTVNLVSFYHKILKDSTLSRRGQMYSLLAVLSTPL